MVLLNTQLQKCGFFFFLCIGYVLVIPSVAGVNLLQELAFFFFLYRKDLAKLSPTRGGGIFSVVSLEVSPSLMHHEESHGALAVRKKIKEQSL